ncbi:MAG TPA: hypothetical protein VI389_06835 [Geobacteraceae bacterium]
MRAISLGGTLYSPRVGSDIATPIAALYWKRHREPDRLRAVIGLFVNEIDASRNFGTWELLGRWENETLPVPSTEIANDNEVKGSSLLWGTFSGFVGAGVRYPVAPFQVDNDFRLQFFFQGGYLYSQPTGDTAPTVKLPPDTPLYGLKLRGRYDGMQRNLMELPHRGISWGFDLDMVRRSRWGDANYGGNLFRGSDTRDYLKLAGYLYAASGIPGMSERNRFIVAVHGGLAPDHDLDRFSAFRIGGGPFPNEADDMHRPYYPGALYNQFPASDFILANFEYRRELLFFLYLHLRGTIIFGKRMDFHSQALSFRRDRGEAFSSGITCGLPGNSQLYLEYGYDQEVLRDGRSGSSFLLLWSKEF